LQYSKTMSYRTSAANSDLWCVVLAAGGSRRLGYPKQLIRHRARPLALRVVDTAQSISPGRVVVVLGAQAARLRALVARNFQSSLVVKNADWESGISTSLITGISAIPATAKGALILLTDQPNVTTRNLRGLVDSWRRQPHRAIAAGYAGGFGVPAILPLRLRPAIRKLTGDMGAKAVLALPTSKTVIVDIPQAAFDIDTTDDHQRLR